MSHGIVIALRVVIALALAGSVVVQTVIVPLLWADLAEATPSDRIAAVVVVVVGVATMQVFAVCVWRLLTLVRHGTVFSTRAFRYVDVIIAMIVVAAVDVAVLAILLAPGGVAPGIVGIVCGISLVLGGMALLVVVMRTLLTQAVAQQAETRRLRSELDEVI